MIALLRRIGAHPTIMPLSARVICARLVRESPIFFAGELLRAPGIRIYALRESGVRVAVRHRSADAATLAEVFRNRWYDPPGEVERALGSPEEILDLGANIGAFGAFALARWPQARIVGYEPDPANAAVHARAIAANGADDRWSLVPAAAGPTAGEVRFAAGLNASSHVLDEQAADDQTISVPMRDVMAAIAAADLVKIDIEGGEWAIILDPRFVAAPPRAVVLEYHAAGCPTPDPLDAALDALQRAGMSTESIWHDAAAGVGMAWAWRP